MRLPSLSKVLPQAWAGPVKPWGFCIILCIESERR